MELSFVGGRFVSFEDELNYKDVLNDFSNAQKIRIATYNISKNSKYDKLLDALKDTNADVKFITNVPSRMPQYFKTTRGQNMRASAKENIDVYISKLNPESTYMRFRIFFTLTLSNRATSILSATSWRNNLKSTEKNSIVVSD